MVMLSFWKATTFCFFATMTVSWAALQSSHMQRVVGPCQLHRRRVAPRHLAKEKALGKGLFDVSIRPVKFGIRTHKNHHVKLYDDFYQNHFWKPKKNGKILNHKPILWLMCWFSILFSRTQRSFKDPGLPWRSDTAPKGRISQCGVVPTRIWETPTGGGGPVAFFFFFFVWWSFGGFCK